MTWPLRQHFDQMIPERWELGRVLAELTLKHGLRLGLKTYLQFDLGRISASYNTAYCYLDVFVDLIPTGHFTLEGGEILPEAPALDLAQANDERVRVALRLLNEDYLLDRLALEA